MGSSFTDLLSLHVMYILYHQLKVYKNSERTFKRMDASKNRRLDACERERVGYMERLNRLRERLKISQEEGSSLSNQLRCSENQVHLKEREKKEVATNAARERRSSEVSYSLLLSLKGMRTD